jgi:osmotically-inducible protein OsmY
MTDAKLRQDIIDEFELDPGFGGEHIGVAVDKDVVCLSGHVDSYTQKLAAIAAARRVNGVHAIAESIDVRYAYRSRPADDQIAQRASDVLAGNGIVPPDSVDVLVHDGWVTLSGTVDWQFQRTAAEDGVRKLVGIVGVTNMIEIKPKVEASDIKAKIQSALKRHAAIEADAVRVTVQIGSTVVPEGNVGNRDERCKAENAAWSAPAGASVDDHLTIDPPQLSAASG